MVTFSSSDDDEDDEELLAELRRNHRKRLREDRGVRRNLPRSANGGRGGRSSSSHSTPRGADAGADSHTVTLPDGTRVERRAGCIFVPARGRHVHVHEARGRPERFFGDPGVHPARRPPLSPSRVRLLCVPHGAGPARASLRQTTLAEAEGVHFYIFKDVVAATAAAAAVSSRATLLQTEHQQQPPPLPRPSRDAAMLASHGVRPSPSALRHRCWAAAPRLLTPLPPAALPLALDPARTAADTCEDVLWALTPDGKVLRRLAFSSADGGAVQVAERAGDGGDRTDGPLRGVCLAAPAPQERARYLVAVRDAGLRVLPLDDGSGSRGASFALNARGSGGGGGGGGSLRCLAPGIPNAAAGGEAVVVVLAGEGRRLLKHTVRLGSAAAAAAAQTALLRRFRTTEVSAVCALSPALCVAGMRNGTLQLVPSGDAATRAGEFDTAPRHTGGVAVQRLWRAAGAPHALVSLSGAGEARLWDVRFLAAGRDPVRTLRQPSRGLTAPARAALCDNVLAVLDPVSGVECVHVLSGASCEPAPLLASAPAAPAAATTDASVWCTPRGGGQYAIHVCSGATAANYLLST